MTGQKLSIRDWAVEDRPREKMLTHGVAAMSDAELLAILIGSGSLEDSAVELMRKVLKDVHDDLNELGKCSVDDLCRYNGIGPVKALKILAASELGKRRKDEMRERATVRTSADIYKVFYPVLCDSPTEECWVLLMNNSMKVIGRTKISDGGIASALVDVRCVLREALLKRATCIALCHNHPSGNTQPSNDDKRLTKKLKESASLMDISLVDHVVLVDGNYYSFADNGLL